MAFADNNTGKIEIPVTEEWNHMFQSSAIFPYSRRPLLRRAGRDDFCVFSAPYSALCGEPVWLYSWGNSRWLRCPMGRPGDRLNSAGDRIAAVDVTLINGEWTFVVSIKERKRARVKRTPISHRRRGRSI
jgi:hypothetical protein